MAVAAIPNINTADTQLIGIQAKLTTIQEDLDPIYKLAYTGINSKLDLTQRLLHEFKLQLR